MTKATAGERFCMWAFELSLYGVREHAHATAAKLDREFAKRDAKVAEDVLAIADIYTKISTQDFKLLAGHVRAKYGKGKR